MGLGYRGLASLPEPHPSDLTRRGLYAPGCCEESSLDVPTHAEGMTLAAALAVAAGAMLGLGAHCQVKRCLSVWHRCVKEADSLHILFLIWCL